MRALLLGVLMVAAAGIPAQAETLEHMKHYVVDGSFEDIRQDVEMAITDRGMIINNVSHIGNMLARTGKDIGAARQIYVEAEALEFCSASISRRMMEADPHNIVFCPYIIAVYTLPGEKDKVHVAFRRPLPVGNRESRAALQAVEKLLDDIVADVVE